MLDQGYDVREFGDIFASLQRMGEAAGQSPIPSWMASHPDPGERVKTAQRRVAELNRPTTNLRTGEAEFLQRISGLVYGENPRNGFFENGVFYHPDMRFRFTIPSGWKAQNTPQAVVAISPQQNAMVQLTLGKGSPEEAARQFLSQQGLQAGQPSRETINGIPAVASQFQAQTQQGVLQGLVAFFGYNGQTYQILGYGPAQGFAANQQAIRQVLGSFAPVNDQRILNVQPSRIEIVRIERPETLGAFAQRTGTTIPISELAILNQVEGAGTQLPVGFLAKRVTPGPGSR
jgi:predicted Zn-dependent protease